ncbi:hypothetical protein GCM10017687_10290 [Streptomyces echinatus]
MHQGGGIEAVLRDLVRQAVQQRWTDTATTVGLRGLAAGAGVPGRAGAAPGTGPVMAGEPPDGTWP